MSENKQSAVSEREKKRKKVLSILVIVCSIAVIILAALKLLRVINIDLHMLVIAVVLMLQSCMFWKTHRALSIFSICVGVFSILVFVLTTFIL